MQHFNNSYILLIGMHSDKMHTKISVIASTDLETYHNNLYYYVV